MTIELLKAEIENLLYEKEKDRKKIKELEKKISEFTEEKIEAPKRERLLKYISLMNRKGETPSITRMKRDDFRFLNFIKSDSPKISQRQMETVLKELVDRNLVVPVVRSNSKNLMYTGYEVKNTNE